MEAYMFNCPTCTRPMTYAETQYNSERLCETCYNIKYPNCRWFNDKLRKCMKINGAYYQMDCIGSGICERWEEA